MLVLDEAGMLGTLDLDEILQHAVERHTKVVLVGDPHHLPEIDAGGCFRALAAQPDIVTLTENRRQRHPHDRHKVELLRAGAGGDALAVACEHGDVVLANNADALLGCVVGDFCAAHTTDGSAVIIAARRSEVAELNARARLEIDRAGQLGAERLELDGGEFAVGDIVVIKRNDKRLGIQNGNRGRVVAVATDQRALRVKLADGHMTDLDARFLADTGRRQQPALVHGYAATAHVMQGQTADRVFVLGSEGISRE
ncbi:AAA domain-containing protein [Solirubrobacter pauli]|uniref:AAA domain-containing protein n=1 Tax=Solirubrobacter pauli TaxID=166793 RepID=A0A660LAA9_9ACTN|nr:AAA domain-containing protein [Solirubrobacter pauli]